MYSVSFNVPDKHEEEMIEMLQKNGFTVRYSDNEYIVQRKESDLETEIGE